MPAQWQEWLSGGAGVGHCPADAQSMDTASRGRTPGGSNCFLATEELKVLRREVEQLRMERDILKKSGGLLCQGVAMRDSLHPGGEGALPGERLVSAAQRGPERLLCVVLAPDQCSRAAESVADDAHSSLLSGGTGSIWQSTDSSGSANPRAPGGPPSRGPLDAAPWPPQC